MEDSANRPPAPSFLVGWVSLLTFLRDKPFWLTVQLKISGFIGLPNSMNNALMFLLLLLLYFYFVFLVVLFCLVLSCLVLSYLVLSCLVFFFCFYFRFKGTSILWQGCCFFLYILSKVLPLHSQTIVFDEKHLSKVEHQASFILRKWTSVSSRVS